MATLQDEQRALSDILNSQEQGGSVAATGVLGAGADVPAVLNSDAALRQQVEENIYRQTGQKNKALQNSQDYRNQQQYFAPIQETPASSPPIGGTQAPTLNPSGQQTISAPLQDQTRSAESTITAEQIRQNELDKLQADIDSIRQSFNSRFQSAQKEGEERIGQTRGLNAASGTTFGAFGSQALGQTRNANQAQIDAINRELAAAIANARAASEGRATTAVQAFEQQARDAAQQELDNRYREQSLSVQQAQANASLELQRQLALGQIDGQSTLDARQFLYGQSQDTIANQQRQQQIDQALTIAEAQGKQLIQRADGSYDMYDPYTGQSQTGVIGADPYQLQQDALSRRGSGGGGGTTSGIEALSPSEQAQFDVLNSIGYENLGAGDKSTLLALVAKQQAYSSTLPPAPPVPNSIGGTLPVDQRVNLPPINGAYGTLDSSGRYVESSPSVPPIDVNSLFTRS